MSDRKEVIATLTEHLDHWERLLSEGICTKDEGERTIDALKFAIASIKTDEAYGIIYEGLDVIPVLDGATNGDMIKALFPNSRIDIIDETCLDFVMFDDCKFVQTYDLDWWNSPYRKEKKC